MQKDANLVELEKCCQTHIFLQNFVSIQPRTSPPKICKKFANFDKFPQFLAGLACADLHTAAPAAPPADLASGDHAGKCPKNVKMSPDGMAAIESLVTAEWN